MSEPAENWELFRKNGLGILEPVRTYECLADAARAIIDIEAAHLRILTLHTTASLGEGGQVDLAIEHQGRHASYLIRNC
jgi:hypothetical protein